MEAFKRFDGMSVDERISIASNMTETDIRIIMEGAVQINNAVNEAIEAMASPNADMASIFELSSGNFTTSGNISKISGIPRILSVNEIEFLRSERFNIINGPDLHVYFTNKGDFLNSKDLGILKGNIGPKYYFLGNIADE
jgi:hypothetical protein